MQTIKIFTQAKLDSVSYGEHFYVAYVAGAKIEFPLVDGPEGEDYDKPFEVEIEIAANINIL